MRLFDRITRLPNKIVLEERQEDKSKHLSTKAPCEELPYNEERHIGHLSKLNFFQMLNIFATNFLSCLVM